MRQNPLRQLIFCFILLAIPLMVQAQDDQPLVADIAYGITVEESITEFAFFDWWHLDVQTGDTIIVSMQAIEGLQPLLGLLDSGGSLVARSDVESVATVDGTSFMEYEATSDGQYTIIASRDGRDQGTTTGRYRLTVSNRNATNLIRANPFLETEFRCDEWLLTNALTFEFIEDVIIPDDVKPGELTEFYRVSVYGIDGFEPVIRILANVLPDRPLDCTDSPRATEETMLDLPLANTQFEVTEENADNVAMVTITNSGDGDPLGDIIISVAGKDGTSGRFVVVLEGLQIQERQDIDEFFVRRGAFASDTDLDIYMIGHSDNRLDSVLETLDMETDHYQLCDDVGSDDCRAFTGMIGSTIVMGDDGSTYIADRFDSGLRIDSPDNNMSLVTFRSRDGNTTGEYTVLFVGELPPRQ